MVVGIIGILAAVAIPAYQSYTNKAREGVTESALRSAARMVRMNQSSLTKTEVTELNKIESKGNPLTFNIFGSAVAEIEAADANWCISVQVTNGHLKASCIDQSGEIEHGTVDDTTAAGVKCDSTGVCKA